MNWTSESDFFAQWLAKQKQASILPNQVNSTINILDRLDNGDLISVMFNATGDLSLKALNLLKHRYEDELYWLNEMNSTRETDDEVDWG
jgi:hypothetical protein